MDSTDILFYIGGTLIVSLIFFVIKLMTDLNKLNFQLELGKVNCQKDLDRLEEKINRIINKESKQVEREYEKLDKIQKSLQSIIDNELKNTEGLKSISNKSLLND